MKKSVKGSIFSFFINDKHKKLPVILQINIRIIIHLMVYRHTLFLFIKKNSIPRYNIISEKNLYFTTHSRVLGNSNLKRDKNEFNVICTF